MTMRIRHASLCLCLLLQLCLCCPALSQTIDFNPDMAANTASLDGYVPLPKLAGVELPRGEVSFEGNDIAVTIIPDWQFDRKTVLSGKLIKVQTILTGTPTAAINGLAYFNAGPWQQYIGKGAQAETITTFDTSYSGTVRTLDSQSLTFDDTTAGTVTIPFNTITQIKSPKAFMLAMPVLGQGTITGNAAYKASATRLALNPTSQILRGALKNDAALRTDGDWSTGKLILVGTALSIAEIAQFLPELIVPLHERALQGTANRLMNISNFPALAPVFVSP